MIKTTIHLGFLKDIMKNRMKIRQLKSKQIIRIKIYKILMIPILKAQGLAIMFLEKLLEKELLVKLNLLSIA